MTRTHDPHRYTAYRRTLAWIGFIVLYAIVPLALILAIYYTATAANTLYYEREAIEPPRTDPFYQQTRTTFAP